MYFSTEQCALEKLEHTYLVPVACQGFFCLFFSQVKASWSVTEIQSFSSGPSGENCVESDGVWLYTCPSAASAGPERVNSPSEVLRFPASCLYPRLFVLSLAPPILPPVLNPTQVLLCFPCHGHPLLWLKSATCYHDAVCFLALLHLPVLICVLLCDHYPFLLSPSQRFIFYLLSLCTVISVDWVIPICLV